MGTAIFSANLKFTLDDQCYILQRELEDKLWRAENTRTGRYIEISEDDFLEKYTKSAIRLHGSDEHNHELPEQNHERAVFDSAPESHQEVARERLHYVLAIRDARLPAHTKSSMTPVIAQAHNRLSQRVMQRPPNWSTVLRWRKRYHSAGQSLVALLPKHTKKGRKPREIDQVVHEVLRDLIESMYLTTRRPLKQDVLGEARDRIRRMNLSRPLGAKLPDPEPWMLERVLNEFSAYERCAGRHGPNTARVKFRGALHYVTAERPLELAEMDHAEMNIIALDDETKQPLGRPWITAVTDVATRYILGYHLSFDPPSHRVAALCLKHAVLPKVNLKEAHKEVRNTWESYGVIDRLVVDNGMEFHGRAFEDMCNFMGTTVQYNPRKTPWFKGHIERWFGTLDNGATRGKPGTTFRDIEERGEYDPEKEASMRLSKLHETVTRWIVDVYHQTKHSALETTPAKKWEELQGEILRALPIAPDELLQQMGKRMERRLDHRGVVRNYLWYNSPDLIAMRRRYGDTLKVTISYDTEDLGSIFVHSPDKITVLEVPARLQTYAAGLSEREHDKIRAKAREKGADCENQEELLAVKSELRALAMEELEKTRRRRRGRGKTKRVTKEMSVAAKEAREAESRSNSEKRRNEKKAKDVDARTPARANTKDTTPRDSSDSRKEPRRRGVLEREPMPTESK